MNGFGICYICLDVFPRYPRPVGTWIILSIMLMYWGKKKKAKDKQVLEPRVGSPYRAGTKGGFTIPCWNQG